MVDVTAVISEPLSRARGQRRRPAADEVIRGRAAEQEMVRDLLRRTQQGRGGVLLVEGEPGLGKSRLLRDSTDAAAGLGFSLAAGAPDQLSRAWASPGCCAIPPTRPRGSASRWRREHRTS